MTRMSVTYDIDAYHRDTRNDTHTVRAARCEPARHTQYTVSSRKIVPRKIVVLPQMACRDRVAGAVTSRKTGEKFARVFELDC